MIKINNIHPGEILSKEFLRPWGLSRYSLSKDAGIRQSTLYGIIKRRKRISRATAVKLAAYFGNSPRFWLELQQDFDVKRRIPR